MEWDHIAPLLCLVILDQTILDYTILCYITLFCLLTCLPVQFGSAPPYPPFVHSFRSPVSTSVPPLSAVVSIDLFDFRVDRYECQCQLHVKSYVSLLRCFCERVVSALCLLPMEAI